MQSRSGSQIAPFSQSFTIRVNEVSQKKKVWNENWKKKREKEWKIKQIDGDLSAYLKW